MRIVNFTQTYEQAVIDLWNETLTSDLVSLQKFRKQIIYDDNFDTELCYVALQDDKVIGFLLGTKRKFPYLERGLEPNRGWINVMFVAKDYQRQGIGSKLVDRVENALIELGVDNITLGAYSPNYFFPGIDIEAYQNAINFFEKKGYVGSEESYSMCKDLHGFYLSDEWRKKKQLAEQKGFIFRNYKNSDAIALLEFAKVNFGGGWKRNALLAMQANEAEDLIYLVLKDEEIVGFAMRKIDGNPMRFGPIGVCEKVRNDGIGGILFELMQQEMCAKGMYHLYFVSTDVPGRRFYERHNVHVFRTYKKYVKTF